MNKPYILLIIILCLGLPILLCAIFKFLPLGSVGPMIPITGIANVFALPYLVYYSISGLIKKKNTQTVFAIASIPIGIFLAVIEMNVFIGLSALFGINDFQLM